MPRIALFCTFSGTSRDHPPEAEGHPAFRAQKQGKHVSVEGSVRIVSALPLNLRDGSEQLLIQRYFFRGDGALLACAHGVFFTSREFIFFRTVILTEIEEIRKEFRGRVGSARLPQTAEIYLTVANNIVLNRIISFPRLLSHETRLKQSDQASTPCSW